METSTRVRATDLRTKREVAREFFSWGSPQLLTIAALAALVVRVTIGDWGWGDLYVILFTLTFTGVVEWVIHLFVLHTAEDSWLSRRVGAGVDHRKHHLDPPELQWLLLHWGDAALFLPLLAGFVATWSLPLLWLTGQPLLTGYLTAVTAAWIGLAHYEWTHLLVHTAYRPKTRYYRRLARNHRLHHYRNERYWLGVTSNMGDRVLGSYPRSKTDVPLSETARTLS